MSELLRARASVRRIVSSKEARICIFPILLGPNWPREILVNGFVRAEQLLLAR